MMPVNTRIAAVVFIVPFTLAVCIVAVDTDPAERDSSASFTGFLVLARNLAQPEDPDDC
jgi:hypothetical protein